MATVLQRQLAEIAANSTHQLDLKAQKSRHGHSLLFESRDAASQSFDTIFQLCQEGFDELCQLDGRFFQLGGRNGIFSENSKEVDRTQLTAGENEELDRILENALGLLQGRLLLKPAMKCVEWLVRRFRIHEYNTESTLLAFLPYHGSDMFPTLLSILPTQQLPVTFKWLQPYLVSLQSPPRSAVLSAISSNAALFVAFNSWVMRLAKARQHSAILLGFWASLTAQAVNGMIDSTGSGRHSVRQQREEDLLLRVLPVLQEALSIKDIPELYLGGCMVIAILVTKTQLQGKVLDAIMDTIAGAWSEQTFDEGLTCLALVAEEKETIDIPNATVRELSKRTDLLQRLTVVGSEQRVSKLIAGLAKGVAKAGSKGKDALKVKLAIDILELDALEKPHAILALRDILTRCAPFQHDSINVDIYKTLSDALERYSRDDTKAELLNEAVKTTEFDLQALQLTASTAIEEVDGGAIEIDEPEARTTDEESQALFDSILQSLPRLPSATTSFLDEAMPHSIFLQYANAWHLAHSSDRNKAAFLGMETFVRMDDSQTVATFLIRAWASTATSAATKATAISATKSLLLASRDQSTQAQYILPYVLTALSDTAVNVRQAAAGLVNALSATISSESKAMLPNVVYGSQSTEKHSLTSKDVRAFVRDAIIPVLEECVLDHNFIARALVDILNDGSVGVRPTQSARHKELKKSLRSDLCSYLAFHAVSTPIMPARLSMLQVLSKVGKSAGQARKDYLLPSLQRWITDSSDVAQAACDAQGVSLEDADSIMLGVLTHRTTDELDTLMKVASAQLGKRHTLVPIAFARLRHLFPLLRGSQHQIASSVLELALRPQTIETVQDFALENLRGLPLSTDVLRHLVESLPNADELQDQPSSPKRRRHSRSEEVRQRPLNGEGVQIAIRRITIVLELLESSKVSNQPQLLPGLFHLLDELHIHKSLIGSELVYLHQMLFSCLIAIIDKLSEDKAVAGVDKSVIRTDLIVECLRTTKSSQIHNLALLLVSRLASWAPELVLHSVMPLFTFMSSTVLRQTDDYSAHVADETVGKIVPPLAQSLKSKGKDIVLGSAELLLSFVAAYEHVPLHRRSSLFELLTTTLGEENVLFALLAMLTERYPLDRGVVGFVAELSLKFDSLVVLRAANQYLDLVADGMQPKRGLSEVLLGFNEKSNDQMQESTQTLVEGLASLLHNKALRSKIAQAVASGDTADTARIRTLYADLLNKAMQFTQLDAQNRPTPEAVAMLLRAVLGLLPTAEFIQSSAQLMQSGSDATRQQVFRSLESRAQEARRGDKTAQQTFIGVLPGCMVYVDVKQSVATRRAAIACIDQISEKFGRTDTDTVAAAAEVVAYDAALGSNDPSLRIISLLTLATMVEVLGDEAIGLLPSVIDKALEYLEGCSGFAIMDQQLREAAFSLLNSVLETSPWTLSAARLDRALVVTGGLAGSQADPCGDQHFCEVAARKIVPTELFAAIERTWPTVLTLSADGRIRHLQTWRDAVKHSTKAVVTKNAQLLFGILLQAFDMRRYQPGSDDDSEEEVFALVNGIAIDLTLKLNDATFRPFFMRLVDWATNSLGKNDMHGRTARLTSVYGFSLALFEQLKSLVTTYASFLSENAAQLLRETRVENANERQLLETVLQTLSSSFRHDQDDFWQAPAHFEEVAAPLVSRLDHAKVVDVSAHAIPTIADLANAVASPDLLKSLNTMLMAKTKHPEAAVRLAAVRCERAVTEKLSLEWLTLLPEILPVISELLEDDSEEVEREVLMWVKEIEDITGEDLGAMLS